MARTGHTCTSMMKARPSPSSPRTRLQGHISDTSPPRPSFSASSPRGHPRCDHSVGPTGRTCRPSIKNSPVLKLSLSLRPTTAGPQQPSRPVRTTRPWQTRPWQTRPRTAHLASRPVTCERESSSNPAGVTSRGPPRDLTCRPPPWVGAKVCRLGPDSSLSCNLWRAVPCHRHPCSSPVPLVCFFSRPSRARGDLYPGPGGQQVRLRVLVDQGCA